MARSLQLLFASASSLALFHVHDAFFIVITELRLQKKKKEEVILGNMSLSRVGNVAFNFCIPSSSLCTVLGHSTWTQRAPQTSITSPLSCVMLDCFLCISEPLYSPYKMEEKKILGFQNRCEDKTSFPWYHVWLSKNMCFSMV